MECGITSWQPQKLNSYSFVFIVNKNAFAVKSFDEAYQKNVFYMLYLGLRKDLSS